MASVGAPYSPADAEILTLAAEIREQSPSLGLPKVLSAIKSQKPTWQLSEKATPYISSFNFCRD